VGVVSYLSGVTDVFAETASQKPTLEALWKQKAAPTAFSGRSAPFFGHDP
jgi:hypothetical protein